MRRGVPSLSDRTALIALGGIVASLSLWFVHAFVGGVILGDSTLTTALVNPSIDDALDRALGVVAILLATLLAQALSVRGYRAERALKTEQSRTRQMYENSPDRIACMDTSGVVLYANSKAGGDDALAEAGQPPIACHTTLYDRPRPCDQCDLAEVVRTGRVLNAVTRETGADGTPMWFDRLLYPIVNAQGAVESVVETARDITALRITQQALERSHTELESRIETRTVELQETNSQLTSEIAKRELVAAALRDSEERYRRLIEHSPDMILVHQDARITFVNPAGLEMLGAGSLEEAVGRDIMSLWASGPAGVTAEDLSHILRSGDVDHPVPLRLTRLDGTCVDVEVTVNRLVFDGDNYVQCVARDITQRLQAEQTIRRMAYYDSLTGLPNRTLFKDRIGRALAAAKRDCGTVAVAFLDLDDFKAINDTLGHGIGDQLLKAVGQRLSGLLRENDTVARHSGDEFTIVARLHSEGDLDHFATRIVEGIRPAFNVSGHVLHVTCSVGLALYPRDGGDVETLLKNADSAMYHAKDLGQSQYAPYVPEMGIAALDRLTLETELRRAVDGSEFELYYQPQVAIATGEITGVEALLRWNHPTQGLLSPTAFLSVAEQAGLMGHLGRWVLREACAQARTWQDAGLPVGRLAVNLGAQEFLRHDIVGVVSNALDASNIEPGLLEIEITESVALQSLDQVLAALASLRQLGVRIAIDDFGTGYSSMSYLQRFPIQTLKIDRSFLRRVGDDAHSAAIASMLVGLCHQLGLDIVAEGVETEAQRDFLHERRCSTAQGNLFCPALPADQVTCILREGLPAAVVQ